VGDEFSERRAVPDWRLTCCLILALALAFQGSRGLWEPDEGFYGTAAAEMYDSGSWLVPTLDGRPFLDKPPLIYWGGIVGMHLLGRNEWGLRLVHALAFWLAALAIGGLASAFWDAVTGRVAALLYATTLGPFLAANVLTPDTLLAAAVAGFYLGYVRAEAATESRSRRYAWLLAGIAAGLGLLAKGPAMLLFAAPILVHLVLRRRLFAVLRQPGPWLGGALAVVVGTSWYLWISSVLPGAGTYILDNQVVGRLATSTYERNAGPLGGLKIYLPTLVALMLPWGPFVWVRYRRARREAKASAAKLTRTGERFDAASSLLWLWILLPLAILMIASSRLPLYALPLAGPLALVSARGLTRGTGDAARLFDRRWRVGFAATCLVLLGVKSALAYWPQEKDSRAFSRLVVAASGTSPCAVVAVDARRQALAFYLDVGMKQVRGFRPDYPYFSPLEPFDQEVSKALRCPTRTVFVFQRESLDEARAQLAAAGLDCAERTEGTRRHAIVVCSAPVAPREPGDDGDAAARGE
jgi:4-amino-4-deoxy-L-arabinose transferase-like glycosyltransferase